MDQEPKLPTPMIEPQKVAEAILKAAVKPERDIKVGAMSKLNTMTAKVAPGLGDKMSAKQADRQQYQEAPRNPEGTLYQAGEKAGSSGQTHGSGGVEKEGDLEKAGARGGANARTAK